MTVATNPATLGLSLFVTRPDGTTPCYSIDLGVGVAGSPRGVVFRNAEGIEIARGTRDAAGRITLGCEQGTTQPLEPTCVPATAPGLCLPGTCH